MLLGPCLAGIILTRIVDGEDGIWDLFSRMSRWRLPARWYAALLIPPILVLAVLFSLETFVSPVYAPNRFLVGIFFGVPAGLLEEIGWMGYAFPKMRSQHDAFAASILLGLLWALWHLPVINYLGTATPHGAYWYAFFLAFTLAMIAMRVSSTGSLIIFSAPRVSAAQEAFWYGLYGITLWVVVAIIAKTYGSRMTRQTA
jgi:membrane protease YdiL (CAAX protease family)